MQTNANRKRLAKQIAEILANPEIPADLYNAITDELTFYSDILNYVSALTIIIRRKLFPPRKEKRK